MDQERNDLDAMSGPHLEPRENIRSLYSQSNRGGVEEIKEAEPKPDRRSARQRLKAERPEKPVRNRQVPQMEQYADEIGPEMEKPAVSEASSNRRDVDYLKRSLEQIAASREKERSNRAGEDWLKDLNPEELKLIGEILQEYLT